MDIKMTNIALNSVIESLYFCAQSWCGPRFSLDIIQMHVFFVPKLLNSLTFWWFLSNLKVVEQTLAPWHQWS